MVKKILIISVVSGFLTQFEKNDVKLLQEANCEIHYVSNFNNPVYTFDKEILKKQGIILHDIPIEKSPKKLKHNIVAIRTLKNIIDECKIDIIHCHNPMGGACGRVAAKLSHRKPYVIYTAHGFHFYKGARLRSWLVLFPIEKILAHFTDMIITLNKEDCMRAKKMHMKNNGKVYQIHGVGVDEKRFSPKPEIAKSKRKEIGIPQNAFHIVQAAELNDNKNQIAVIDALHDLKNDNIYYSICGEGPNRKYYEDTIRNYCLQKKIKVLGFRTDMDELLQTADVFVFPSEREGFGIAAVEALLSGVPLIAGDNRGTREYAVNGVNSIVVDPGDVLQIKEAINTLYCDRQKLNSLKKQTINTAKKFRIAEVEKIMRKIYATALREAR